MSTPVKLAEKDAEMLNDLTIKIIFIYILATVGGKGQGDKIKINMLIRLLDIVLSLLGLLFAANIRNMAVWIKFDSQKYIF